MMRSVYGEVPIWRRGRIVAAVPIQPLYRESRAIDGKKASGRKDAMRVRKAYRQDRAPFVRSGHTTMGSVSDSVLPLGFLAVDSTAFLPLGYLDAGSASFTPAKRR